MWQILAFVAGFLQLTVGLGGSTSATFPEGYAEDLQLQPLSRNTLLSTFSFGMDQTVSDKNNHLTEYTVFPRSLGQILKHSQTRELHLRFGQGWWDADTWGAPPDGGASVGGIGVELCAWVRGADLEEARANWHRLVHALSGYFCASINFIDETQTTFPSPAIIAPQGRGTDDAWLMRGALPAEPVCTENLTPFLKLLPCKGKAGIASLLDGHTLFNSLWQTMSVDVFWPEDSVLRLDQKVTNVIDTTRSGRDPLPFHEPLDQLECDRSKPWSNDWTCFPVARTKAEYSLSSVFGSAIAGRCPLAADTTVNVVAPANWHINGSESTRKFKLSNDLLDLRFESETANNAAPAAVPALSVDRSFSGSGQQSGGIRTVFTNPTESELSVSYFETLPWFMRVYLHTLTVSSDGTLVAMDYVPSQDRARPSQLELTLEIPAKSKLAIEYAFDKSLLFIEEYPPDANHGFEVPPGVAVTITRDGKYFARTSSLLLSLPVPDFSMPYNVIILTSTVMALAFGTIYNLIVRTVTTESVAERYASHRKSPLDRLRDKLKSFRS